MLVFSPHQCGKPPLLKFETVSRMKIEFPLGLKALLVLTFVAVGTQHLSADQVIADNLVVQEAVSIGQDAVSGWSYGYDSLVFRENNMRILFDDTSSSAGYPSNDWRIAINDTTSGGASYFAIEDSTAGKTPFKITAGAANNALYVGTSGIGINTGNTDPHLKLWVNANDTPGVRLEQDSTGGFTAQTWDVAGNEANFFIRDLTGGSRLCFRIRPGAPTSTLDLSAKGWVGVGTSNPRAKLHVEADGANGEGMVIGKADDISTNLATLHVDGSGYFTSKLGVGPGSSGKTNALYVAGTAFISQTLEIGSSRATKENIRDVTLDEAKATLKDLKPVQYNYIGDGQHQLGFIAEDVPDAVATRSRKSIVPMDFVAVLTKVVQDHERRETELQQTIQSQQEQLKTLTERLSAMEQRVKTTSASTQP